MECCKITKDFLVSPATVYFIISSWISLWLVNVQHITFFFLDVAMLSRQSRRGETKAFNMAGAALMPGVSRLNWFCSKIGAWGSNLWVAMVFPNHWELTPNTWRFVVGNKVMNHEQNWSLIFRPEPAVPPWAIWAPVGEVSWFWVHFQLA